MLLLQSACPVASRELCCGFLLELRSFLEEGFRENHLCRAWARWKEPGAWCAGEGLGNTARLCNIPPKTSLISHLPLLRPWLLIILADTQLCFPQDLCIVDSPQGTLLTYMQHLCPILLEKGHPWRAVVSAVQVSMATAGEDEEDTAQGFPCSTFPMGLVVVFRSALVSTTKERAGGAATSQQPVMICVTLSPWGEMCKPNSAQQERVGLGGQPLAAQGLSGWWRKLRDPQTPSSPGAIDLEELPISRAWLLWTILTVG